MKSKTQLENEALRLENQYLNEIKKHLQTSIEKMEQSKKSISTDSVKK